MPYSDPVTIAAITTIGGVLGAYIKFEGDRRERKLNFEIKQKAAALDEANLHRQAQSVFNDEVAQTITRMEQKIDTLTGRRNGSQSVESKLVNLEHRINQIDDKTNVTLTNTEVIKSSLRGGD